MPAVVAHDFRLDQVIRGALFLASEDNGGKICADVFVRFKEAAVGLAVAKLQPSQFQLLYNHLISHKPPYRTMHLREARYRNKKRVLRYLHAMHAMLSSLGHLQILARRAQIHAAKA